MSKTIKILLVVGAVVLTTALVFGGVALAKSKDGSGLTNLDSSEEYSMGPGFGPGFRGGVIIDDTLTNLLGMTKDEIQTQLREGKSLVEVAAAKNVTEDTLITALVDAEKARLQEKVTSGDLTQKQVDRMLQRSEELIKKMVEFKLPTTSHTGGPGRMGGNIVFNDALTNLLGMTMDEIQTQLREGKSLIEIAATQSIDEQTVQTTLIDNLKTKLQKAVANEDMTQKVADSILQRAEEDISKIINNKFNGSAAGKPKGMFRDAPGFGGRGMRSGGMMLGHPGEHC